MTVWEDAAADRSRSMSFRYSNRPPYVNQFTWEPGKVTYLVTDAAGAVLLDRVVTRGVPTPSTEVPVINYWRYGRTRPGGERSMRISSFTWIPPGGDVTPPVVGGLGGSVSMGERGGPSGEGESAPGCVRVGLSPRRFSAAHGATIRWMATAKASLRMRIERRVGGRRFIGVRALARTVRQGRGPDADRRPPPAPRELPAGGRRPYRLAQPAVDARLQRARALSGRRSGVHVTVSRCRAAACTACASRPASWRIAG